MFWLKHIRFADNDFASTAVTAGRFLDFISEKKLLVARHFEKAFLALLSFELLNKTDSNCPDSVVCGLDYQSKFILTIRRTGGSS
ncbi:unnamed protein product [Brugia pahangi]|uniref:Transposase n=1 Tax=Brugia pahangi TaxID=6280 RepID=A0A0N4T1S3_BRUPA|nr:unnamed protein product [Brugia pahangi]